MVLGFVRYHAGAAIFIAAFLLYARKFKTKAQTKFREMKKVVFEICEEIHAKEIQTQQKNFLQHQQQLLQQQQQQQLQQQQQQMNFNRRSVPNASIGSGGADGSTSSISAPDSSQSFLGLFLILIPFIDNNYV